jgi:putative salt-induced outer membrane protein YdiY
LSTDAPVYVQVDENNRVQATMRPADSGTATLSGGDWLETGPIALARVSGMTRKPEPPVKVTGRINVGASSTSGNTDTEKLNANAEIIARTVKNRFTIGGVVNRAEDSGVETESNWIAYLKYDHFITKRWYAYSNADMESDEFKDINLRTTLGVGSGYQFYETPQTNLSLEGGVNYVNTDYDIGQDDSYPAGRVATRFDHFLFGSKTQFFHRNEGFFALDDSDNLFVRTQTGLRWPVIERLAATAQYNVDWDDNPAPGRSSTDRTVLFTLGYHW